MAADGPVLPPEYVALETFTNVLWEQAKPVLLGNTSLGSLAPPPAPPRYRDQPFEAREGEIRQRGEVQDLLAAGEVFECCAGNPGCRGLQHPDDEAEGETKCFICGREKEYCQKCGRYFADVEDRECCGIPRDGHDKFTVNPDDAQVLHNSQADDDKLQAWFTRSEGKRPWGPELTMRHLGRIAAAIFHMQRNQPKRQTANTGPRNTLAATLRITNAEDRKKFDSFVNGLWRSCCYDVPQGAPSEREFLDILDILDILGNVCCVDRMEHYLA